MGLLAALRKQPIYQKDKGYAWLVLIMSALSHSMLFGFTTAILGNMTIVHQSHFGIGLQHSSLIGTLHLGVIFIFGPFASVLVKKVGCRLTQIFGGTCAVLGVGLSYFAVEPWQVIMLFSVLCSVGVSSAFVASSEILALNFDKYKYLAFSLAVLIEKAGVIANPIASQTLFSKCGYSKAMAIMATVHIVHILAGVLFFQPAQGANEEGSTTKDDAEKITPFHEQSNYAGRVNKALDITEKDVNKLSYSNDSEEYKEEKLENEMDKRASTKNEVNDFDVRKSVLNLLHSRKIWAYLINSTMWKVNSGSFHVLLNDFIANHIHLTGQEAALGVTIAGGASIGGCTFIMLISRIKIDRVIINFASTLLLGVATIVMSFSSSKPMFYGLTALCGIGQGVLVSNLLGAVTDMVEDVKLVALLLGLDMVAGGAGSLGGTQLASFISDRTGEQNGIIFSGVAAFVASLVMLPVIISRIKHRSF